MNNKIIIKKTFYQNIITSIFFYSFSAHYYGIFINNMKCFERNILKYKLNKRQFCLFQQKDIFKMIFIIHKCLKSTFIFEKSKGFKKYPFALVSLILFNVSRLEVLV